MKRNQFRLFVDQYGNRVYASTVKELREKSGGGGRVNKMYRDRKNGGYVHVGYVVGPHWYTAYVPLEIPA